MKKEGGGVENGIYQSYRIKRKKKIGRKTMKKEKKKEMKLMSQDQTLRKSK